MKVWWFAGSPDTDGDSIRLHSNESGVLDDICCPYVLIPLHRYEILQDLIESIHNFLNPMTDEEFKGALDGKDESKK